MDDDSGPDVWEDTTTLYVKVFEGDVDEAGEAAATVRGAGIIRIELFDFMKQMTTFRVEGGTIASQVAALSRFGKLFLGKLWDVYGQAAIAGRT